MVKDVIGSRRKCPHCGVDIESFQSRCPNCNSELAAEINPIVQQFGSGYSEKQSKRKMKPIWFEKGGLLNKRGVLKEQEWEAADEDLKQFVENFQIPNARGDFVEFFIFAASFIVQEPETKYLKKWNDIWAGKLKQVYTKARIAMSGEPEMLAYMKQLAGESGVSL